MTLSLAEHIPKWTLGHFITRLAGTAIGEFHLLTIPYMILLLALYEWCRRFQTRNNFFFVLDVMWPAWETLNQLYSPVALGREWLCYWLFFGLTWSLNVFYTNRQEISMKIIWFDRALLVLDTLMYFPRAYIIYRIMGLFGIETRSTKELLEEQLKGQTATKKTGFGL